MSMRRIYLAGGLRTNWQDQVIAAVPGAHFLDPRTAPQEADLATAAAIELAWIDTADAVFAYLEKTNPTGLGLAAEIGYGRRAGARIFFVDERGDRSTAWLQHLADDYCTDIAAGLLSLARWAR